MLFYVNGCTIYVIDLAYSVMYFLGAIILRFDKSDPDPKRRHNTSQYYMPFLSFWKYEFNIS